jgi:hypothetical protein
MTFSNAVRAQFRLAAPSHSLYFLLAICLAPWIINFAIFYLTRDIPSISRGAFGPGLLISPAAGAITFSLGLVWGIAVWRHDPPTSRLYHWSLPVDTAVHDLARVVSYCLWLLAGLSIYVIVGAVLMTSQDMPVRFGQVGILPWVALYAAGIIGFGFGAALSTAFNKPVEIVFGIWVLIITLSGLAVSYKWAIVLRPLDAMLDVDKPYSLMGGLVRGGAVGQHRYASGVDPQNMLPVVAPMLLWLMISTLVVVAASYRNRGRVV